MKQKILGLMACVVAASGVTASAVKADPRPREVTMPDGSAVTLQLIGDEHAHYYRTPDGYPVERAADGFFYFLDRKTDGSVALSGIRPGGPGETDFKASANLPAVYEALRNRNESKPSRRAVKKRAVGTSTYPTHGQGRGIVVLVEYRDVKFKSPDPNGDFYRMLNERGYSDNGATGCAAEWFIDNSMGQFIPEFDVYGPITLAHEMSYYGKNDSKGDDINAHFMAVEACQQLDDIVDFTVYDRDGDGFIDNVYVFYAGYGENLGGAPSESVWPHSWDLTEATTMPYMFDGVRLDHYACSNELNLDNVMDGIGTFCHEFSHVLGLPDLYATNYSTAFTPGEWSVMDEGSYNNGNRTPPYYTAYERFALGWLTPRVLDRPANVKLDHVAANTACMIKTSKDNEYFILENRQQKGWDRYIPYHGMLIWHIDYNENIWNYNTVNNAASHQYVDIEEADGLPYYGSIDGDPFPGAAGITSFTDDTQPGMLSWDGERQNRPITDIRESNGYIYFKVSGGQDETTPVVANEAKDVEMLAFTASWEEGDYGCDYYLSVFTTDEVEEGKYLINYVEGFNNRNVGEKLEYKVENLEPATRYFYTVTAYDRDNERFSVASNRVEVTTLDPTFDYLRPEIISVTDLAPDSFTLEWTEVEGADSYLLDVFTKEYGEEDTLTVDFTGGLSAMPAGWYTPSTFTYGVEDYCGEAVPSLRLNSSAPYLNSGTLSGGIRSLSFWHRGIGTSDSDRIVISALGTDGVWKRCAEIEVCSDPGGTLTVLNDLADNSEWPGYFSSIQISFETEGKGAIAVDDVRIGHSGSVTRVYAPFDSTYEMGKVSTFHLSGLTPETVYWVTVSARSGDLLSRASAETRVITLDPSGIRNPGADGDVAMTTLREGDMLEVKGIRGDRLILYTIDGRILVNRPVDSSCCSVKLPARGLYILTDGHTTRKINY